MKQGFETLSESNDELLDRIFTLSEQDMNKTIAKGHLSEGEALEIQELAKYAKSEVIKYKSIFDFLSTMVSFTFWAFLLSLLAKWIESF